MKRIKKLTFTLGLLVISITLLNSCSLLVPSPPENEKSEHYSIHFSRKGWEEINPDISDHAYIHRESNSIVLVNSMCKKYEASSYNHLISNMLSGFEDIKYERKEEINLFGRKASRFKIKASLDGIMTYFIFISVRKNRCLYDFALITDRPEHRIELTNDFEEFVSGMRIK